MYLGKSVSIVFPVFNEAGNVKRAIEAFLAHPAVDELVAVDNNSTDGSDLEIKKTAARYVNEPVQGYGAAMQRGMGEAAGDIIVTVEPDGTFRPEDLDRFLVYGRDYEVVLGTRTARVLIWTGGDMDLPLRLGNLVVAKYLEFLFSGPSLTDVGCSYKLIHRAAYEKVKNSFAVTGWHFSPDFMMQVLIKRLSIVEIPIQFQSRVGASKLGGIRWKAILLGFRMLLFITITRLKHLKNP
jgi:glycosyltransferase involved in cell wall biosynthesis